VDAVLIFHLIKFVKSPVYENFLNFRKIKLSSLLAICLLLTLNAHAQNVKIDSLKNILGQKSKEEKFDVLYELGYQTIPINIQEALEYGSQAYDLAIELGDSLRIVKSVLIRGSALRRLERLDEAINVSIEGLGIAKRNNFAKEVKILLNSIAIAYSLKAEYDKALEFHYQSLVIREAEGDKFELSVTVNNIGFVYFKLKNYEKAVEYFERAVSLRKETKDPFDLDRFLINLGTAHVHLKNFARAQSYIKEGFSVCGDKCNDQIKVEGEFSLGVSFLGLGDVKQAKEHFEKSLEISRTSDNKRFQAENLVYLGKIAVRENNNNKGRELLQQAEAIAGNSGYNQLMMDTYKQFSILYNNLKDYENAAIYQQKYISLKDSLIGEDLVKNIAKIQTNYAERENIKKIADKEEQIERQRSLNFAIIIIAILATLLIFVLYRSNQVKKKVNAALSEAKQIIEDQNRQLLNSNYNLDKELKIKNADLEKANESLRRVNDELDNFIYKTSHDIRGPLASLKGMCNVALMDVTDPVALGYLRKLDITAEKLNTILTRLLIVNQINNSTLGMDKIDFSSIVSDVLMLEKKKGLPSRLKVTRSIDDDIEFYSDKEFIRIILENLIDNAIKFYNDSDRIEPFVDISVVNEGDHIKIKVVDNGIGISEVHPDKIFQMFSRASERSETGGIGLYITKTAAEKLGGTVNLKTTPEGYTEFYARLPLSMNRVMA
jgi:signal transduction histidine kinase